MTVTATKAGRRPVPTRRPLLSRIGGSSADRHLVCFPHAGGSGSALRWWATPDLGRSVWAATLPGRGRLLDEAATCDWRPLVSRLADEMSGISGAIVLVGHSLGAVLAYEVARALAHRGRELDHLVVVSRGAPETGPVHTWPESDYRLLELVARRYGGIPEALWAEPELLRAMASPLRSDLELVRRYAWVIGPPLGCPITAVAGERDDTVPYRTLAAWGRHTRADFHATTIPGGHFFDEQERTALLDIVRRRALT